MYPSALLDFHTHVSLCLSAAVRLTTCALVASALPSTAVHLVTSRAEFEKPCAEFEKPK